MKCESPLVDIPTLSKEPGMSRARLVRLAERRILPGAVRLGSRWLFKTEVLKRFFEQELWGSPGFRTGQAANSSWYSFGVR